MKSGRCSGRGKTLPLEAWLRRVPTHEEATTEVIAPDKMKGEMYGCPYDVDTERRLLLPKQDEVVADGERGRRP